MAKLTSKERNNLKTSTFAIPGKRAYLLPDASHARNALARVSQFGSSEEKSKVRSAVARKFPGIGGKKKSPRTTATRKNPGQYRHHSQTRARRRG
jgi:hypothetical protein